MLLFSPPQFVVWASKRGEKRRLKCLTAANHEAKPRGCPIGLSLSLSCYERAWPHFTATAANCANLVCASTFRLSPLPPSWPLRGGGASGGGSGCSGDHVVVVVVEPTSLAGAAAEPAEV